MGAFILQISRQNEGYTLVEVIVAMAVLGIGMVSVITAFNVILMGNTHSKNLLNAGLKVNNLYEEIALEVSLSDGSSEAVSECIEKVLRNYPEYRSELEKAELEGLYNLKLIYRGRGGIEKVFYTKLAATQKK